MAFNFPDSPNVNDEYTAGDRTWVWDGTVWLDKGSTLSFSELTNSTHASTHESGGSDEIEIAQSQVTGLDTGTEGQVVLSDGTSGVKFETGYLFRETVYFESSGTFSKASYPWLKAIRVKVQGAGGGGGSTDGCGLGDAGSGSGGQGGGYAESFISNISSLSSSVSITVGAGGSGGAAGGTGIGSDGTTGGASSFGLGELFEVSGEGGGRGKRGFETTNFRAYSNNTNLAGGVGDFVVFGKTPGTITHSGTANNDVAVGTNGGGGDSFLGTGAKLLNVIVDNSFAGENGTSYGGGGSASLACSTNSSKESKAGGDGADGIVILELFA